MSRYVYQEFPKTLYRINARGELESRTFAREEDVDHGWLEHGEAMRAVVNEAVAAEPAPRRYRELQDENARLKETVKFLEDELKLARARIETLEADNARAPLDAALADLAPPPPRRKRKPSSES